MKKFIKSTLSLVAMLSFTFVVNAKANSLGVVTEAGDDGFITKDHYTIYPSIPFIEGADLMAFHEAYSRTRSEQFGELVQSAQSLLKAGATGKEALEMIMAFDGMITKRRADSKKRMGISLEGYFNSRLNDLYQLYQPQNRRLDFRHVQVPSNILAYASRNQRIGMAGDELLSDLDYVIYGSFTVNRNKGMIDVAIYAVNVQSGETRVYGGTGYPEMAAYQAADKLFDDFQKTRMPKNYRLRNGKTLTLVKEGRVGGGNSSMKNLYARAQIACEAVNARLMSEEEALSLDSLGRYNGGITMFEELSNFFFNRHSRNFYYWALKDQRAYNAAEGRSSDVWNLNHADVLNYICVQGR